MPPAGLSSPAVVATLAGWLAERDLALGDLRTGQSLEEAYLAITGARGGADLARAAAPGTGVARRSRRSPSRRSSGAAAGPVRPLAAQLRAEVTMLFTNGETLFLTLGIPVVFLLFFSAVHVLPTGTKHPVDFLVPGILALAVMSTAMTALGIGTGFERGYGVLKRLGSTPSGRPRLLAAKITAIIGVELLQAAVLVAVGYALGWNPGGPGGAGARVGAAIVAMVLGTVAFGGIGLILAGTLKPLVNLAVVNGLFVVLLLLGGMLIPLGKLPTWLADVSKVLPASALADALHGALGHGHPGVGPGLGGAGGVGGGRPGGGRPHLPLGVSRPGADGRTEWRETAAGGRQPGRRPASGRGATQPVQPLVQLALGRPRPGCGPPPDPRRR